MKAIKKVLSTILVCAVVLGMCACGSQNVPQGTEGSIASPVVDSTESKKPEEITISIEGIVVPNASDFSWEEVDGGVKITGYHGEATSIQIPDKIEGQDVIELGSESFSKDYVVNVRLADSIERISDRAFFNSKSLKSIEFGKNVKTMGKEVFYWCENLSYVGLNEGLQEIGDSAFVSCPSLKSINMPSSVEKIQRGAFFLSGLELADVPGTVKYVGEGAFQQCNNLKKVTFHEGVEVIDDEALCMCDNLEEVNMPSSLQSIEYAVLSNSPNAVIYGYSGSVAEKYAKDNNIEFSVRPGTPESIETSPTEKIEGSKEERVYTTPEESDFTWEEVENGVAITQYTGKYKNVDIPDTLGGKNVVELRRFAFKADHIEGIKIPDTVTVIEEQFMSYSPNLVEVEFGSGVKIVKPHAFAGCNNLSSVKFNEGLEVIERNAFGNDEALRSVTFPKSLVEIGDSAFVLSGLEYVLVPGNVRVVGKEAFKKCNSLRTADIEEGVEVIKDQAFELCHSLERINVPASANELGKRVIEQKTDIIFSAPAGSFAESYAKDNGYRFEVS